MTTKFPCPSCAAILSAEPGELTWCHACSKPTVAPVTATVRMYCVRCHLETSGRADKVVCCQQCRQVLVATVKTDPTPPSTTDKLVKFRCPSCEDIFSAEPGQKVQCVSCTRVLTAPVNATKKVAPRSRPDVVQFVCPRCRSHLSAIPAEEVICVACRADLVAPSQDGKSCAYIKAVCKQCNEEFWGTKVDAEMCKGCLALWLTPNDTAPQRPDADNYLSSALLFKHLRNPFVLSGIPLALLLALIGVAVWEKSTPPFRSTRSHSATSLPDGPHGLVLFCEAALIVAFLCGFWWGAKRLTRRAAAPPRSLHVPWWSQPLDPNEYVKRPTGKTVVASRKKRKPVKWVSALFADLSALFVFFGIPGVLILSVVLYALREPEPPRPLTNDEKHERMVREQNEIIDAFNREERKREFERWDKAMGR